MIKLLTTAAVLALVANVASAEESPRDVCQDYDQTAAWLKQEYKEEPIAGGLTHTGKLMQVFATEDGSTWTVVMTNPDGTACVVSAGKHWMFNKVKGEMS